jgi:membrane protein implicated in regulation of membrane protease activity
VPTFVRYIGFQLPSWLVAGGIAMALDAWEQLPRIWLVGAVLLYMAKDFALYPWVRTAYEGTVHDHGARLIGARAVVVVPLDPSGWVQLGSERWRAELRGSAEALDLGSSVSVSDVRGHVLLVEEVSESGS